MRDVLITGTDTGVGKTVVAAALVKALRGSGVRALGFKPVETGLEDAHPSDSAVLQRASGDGNSLAVPLLQLAEPLAPAVAAERAGMRARAAEIEERISALRRAGYALVVEGAGGLMVPLSWEPEAGPCYTALDLAVHCGLDAVIVARAGLGTLNHVAMTVAMLRSSGVTVKGVVLNGARRPATDLAETTNPNTLARMLPGLRIITVPQHAGSNVIDATVPYVSELIS